MRNVLVVDHRENTRIVFPKITEYSPKFSQKSFAFPRVRPFPAQLYETHLTFGDVYLEKSLGPLPLEKL